MKEKRQSKLMKFIRTNKYKYMRNLTMFLILALVGCGSFIGGVLYRNNAMRYSGTYSHTTEQTTTASETTTTTPPEVTTTVTTTEATTARKVLYSEGIAAKIISSECAQKAEYKYTNFYSYSAKKEYKDINIPFTKKSYTMTYDGTVYASMHIDDVSVSVDNDAQTITIVLPQAQITEHVIDEESIKFTDKSKNIFNPLTEDDYNKVYAEENTKMEEKAIANGLLDKVRENTQKAVTDLLMKNPDIAGAYSISFAGK